LPSLEIILAIFLFLPKTKVKALYIATALMFAFTTYVIYLILFHPTLPCTCGGFLKELSWPQHLIFNSIFLCIGLLALFLIRRNEYYNQSQNLQYLHHK
jgi:hypothetical protein